MRSRWCMRSKWIALLMLFVAISAGAQEYKSALPGYKYEFPRDYFNHEEYQTEWWYFKGKLRAADGHRFGFELTFFRQGLSRDEGRGIPGLKSETLRQAQGRLWGTPGSRNGSPWFVHDVWMAHLALSDVTGQGFYHEERLNRAGPGLAGVDEEAGLVWKGNWQGRSGRGEGALGGVGKKVGVRWRGVRGGAAVSQ